MSFFIRGARKRAPASKSKKVFSKDSNNPTKKKKLQKLDDEEILSDSDIDGPDDDEGRGSSDAPSENEEEEQETAQEKRLRLTKQYLAQLEAEEKEVEDSLTPDRDAIAHRLKSELLEQSGKLQKLVASEYTAPSSDDLCVLRGHQLAITCMVISSDNKYIFSGSKDCSIIKWNAATGKKEHKIPGGRKGTEDKHIGHTAHILALAISSDDTLLVSGCRNKLIHVWDPQTCGLKHTFKGHRDAISGLAFRKGTHQLFSASHDRSVKIWNLDEMAYVETLFGHQDAITGIDSLTRDRSITSGGRDNSIRVWKVLEESQLIFNGHSGSIDCVKLINEDHFISGSEDGSIAVWSVMKKKPLSITRNAHPGPVGTSEGSNTKENWISCVAALQGTDLVASAGSKDGTIRFWQCSEGYKTLSPTFQVTMEGFVNAMQFSSDGTFLVAGVGQEHRLGRWWRLKEAKNSIVIVRLRKSNAENIR
ncbi:U3 small nucleolar RNA-interacting protein 2 isoform X1 [Strongylocentrotus purpuratus]|uniref:U3 small nucleolar RNA-interacting protein 2 n=1 Tax=Strongylocentrotus purpuratus TaxID=7668 RepID=A0A7M7HNW7_STRPU|nr:U3 small nucleolar RNA-interacting protein 2 isoform X1 [Strongylocentrotus purpuratus]